jgi:glycosyltransferase involved in cell wall biosynthesis
MKSEISVVIPTLDNFLDVKKVIFSIDSQDLLPSEIILADSSSSSQIENNITDLQLSVPIRYLRVGKAYKYDRLLYRLFYFSSLPFFKNRFPKGRAFPYEATNAGASIARYKWIAFLDGTTTPTDLIGRNAQNAWLT